MLFLISTSNAAELKGHLKFERVSVKKTNNQVVVSFNIIVDKFNSNDEIVVMPILQNDNNRAIQLEPIMIVGKSKDLIDQRAGNTGGNRRIVKGEFSRNIPYLVSIPFEEWMQNISIVLDQVIMNCCNVSQMPLQTIVENQLLYHNAAPNFTFKPLEYKLTELEQYDLDNPFLHSMEDYDKRYEILFSEREEGTSVVKFKNGKYEIDMDYQGNKDVLKAIGKAIQLINNDPKARLKHIMIAGYASPEGSLDFNTKLAQNRALSVKKFIQVLLKDTSKDLFELYNGREDWDGLRKMVEQSNMADRSEILQIIDFYSIEQEMRKTKLQQLNEGVPYHYMLENFYPSLRCAGYIQLYYEIDRRAATTVVDARGRATWVDSNSSTNRAVTVINKGIKLMVDNKFNDALSMLMEFENDPRVWNLIGVCHMMKGNYTFALEYFDKAIKNGDSNAVENKMEIEKIRSVAK